MFAIIPSLSILLIAATPLMLRGQDPKIESQILLPPEPGMQYTISPKGLHLAGVVLRGSRQVVVFDGVDGPRFDKVLNLSNQTGGGKVTWSEDGARYAYHGKQGQEYVIVVDGKEVSRGPWSAELEGQGQTPVHDLGFSPGGKHWYAVIQTRTPTRQNWQLIIDGVAGPVAPETIAPLFSPDGEHHTYLQQLPTASGPTRQVLIIDGKPAPYVAGDMQWTGDSKHLITKRLIPGSDLVEVLADGQVLMRVPGGVQFTMAPTGPAILGRAWTPFQGATRNSYLIIGNRRAVGSECSNSSGLDAVYMSADAKHYAARCPSNFMFVDGKKGQEYPEGVSHLVWTDDGRPVYQAKTNQRAFMIVGDQEAGPYGSILDNPVVTREDRNSGRYQTIPAVVRGNHVAYIARTNPNDQSATVVVVDGKAIPAANAVEVSLSPDGSRYAFLAGRPTMVTVDGTAYPNAAIEPTIGNVGYQGTIQWSGDSKHVAWVTAYPSPGVALDGKLIQAPGMTRFVHFTADGKHLVWLVRSPSTPEHFVYLDGKKVLTLPQNLQLENEADVYWSFPADGSISFVAGDHEGMKRYRIVPGGP